MKKESEEAIFRAFRYRNYRLFFTGQGISLIGTWMQIIAVSWLTYRLTNSKFLLGLVGFTGQIPIFLLSPFAGVLADMSERRRILLITQTFSMLQALILALLVLTGNIAVWHIFVLSAFLGLVSAFDVPARQAFVVDIVDRVEDVGNAIALNSLIFNTARLIGPSIAGILIATVGEGICFLLNSISFLAVIIALSAMKIKPRNTKNAKRENGEILFRLKEGFDYVSKVTAIKYILLLVAIVSLMGMSYAVLMPVFAKEVLGGDSRTLGLLMAAVGVGALVGAAYLASRKNIYGLEKVILISTIIFGMGLIAFSFSRVLWISLLLLLCVGFGMIIQMISSNTLLQNLTDDDKRGRVMSFFAMAFMGIAPFGSLLAGTLASRIGAPNTVLISGFFCTLSALFCVKVLKTSSQNSSRQLSMPKDCP